MLKSIIDNMNGKLQTTHMLSELTVFGPGKIFELLHYD